MNNNTERDEKIFKLWNEENYSIKEIAQMEIEAPVALKWIRNIVYSRGKFKSEHNKKIFALFREKFLEFQDVNKAVYYVYENQPKRRFHQELIRIVIKRQLKERGKKFQSKYGQPKQQFVPDYSDCHGY